MRILCQWTLDVSRVLVGCGSAEGGEGVVGVARDAKRPATSMRAGFHEGGDVVGGPEAWRQAEGSELRPRGLRHLRR